MLAKALNCHSSDKPIAVSCNECASCKEIAEGRSIDVMEFDAASNTQVDKIRDLIIENINIAPARDRYKIFIIDEVHMLSTSSFNALLKTLEEPPPRVVFVMATTELHKVPVTILSRCQEFEFRTIATGKIFERLNLIAEAEGVKVTAEALREIARSGEGSMRDAQSNFDQVISFSDENIGIEEVITALGIASSEILTRTVEAIAHHKTQEALLVVEELTRRGQDLRNYCRDLLTFLRDLLVAKVTDHSESLLDSSILDREALKKYAEHFSESDLVRLFHSLAETEDQLRKATQPRYILEIGLVKLMEMRRVSSIENLLERLTKLEESLNGGGSEPEKKSEPIAEKKTLNKLNSGQLSVDSAPGDAGLTESKTESLIQSLKSKIQNDEPDFPLDEVPFPINSSPYVEKAASPVRVIETGKYEASRVSSEFLDSLPVRLPDISEEELEHVEDAKLDAAFEERLAREGDNLFPIKTIRELTAKLFTPTTDNSAETAAAAAAGKSRAYMDFQIPDFPNENESIEKIELSENPTEDELFRFAENNLAVRRTLRIFRGKIVSVNKT